MSLPEQAKALGYKNLSEVGRCLGISRSYFYRYRNGMPLVKIISKRRTATGSNPAISINEMAFAFELLTMGKSIKEISGRLCVHPSTLQRRIIKAESEGFKAFRGKKNV